MVAKPYLLGDRLCADDLFDLVYSVPAGQRNGATFRISTAAEREISYLKDGNGRRLYTDLSGCGRLSTLLGYPVVWDDSPSLPAVKAIQFGSDVESGILGASETCRYCSRRPEPLYKYCPGCGAPR